MLVHGAFDLDQCSKHVVRRKYVPFADVDGVPLNFGVQSPEMKFWVHEFQASTTTNSNTYNLNTIKSVINKCLQGIGTINGPSWVVP